MKYGPWKVGGACDSCQLPVEIAAWCWKDGISDICRNGFDFDCCPHCGKMCPEGGWPQVAFRRVKDGWFGPWRWQKWQEPVASGVQISFTMSQPPEEQPPCPR